MHVQTWSIPTAGIFDFDFQCFDQQPTAEENSSKEDIVALLEWFEMTYDQILNNAKAMGLMKTARDIAMKNIGTIMGECFRGIAEYFVFNKETLGLFVDLIDDPTWKFLVYSAGVGRMYDIQNFDFIKHRGKGAMKEIYDCFGLANLFSPFRPNGNYLLNLAIYEEK